MMAKKINIVVNCLSMPKKYFSFKQIVRLAQLTQLSEKAAKFMILKGLVMRNSNTKQLISRHYNHNNYLFSHGIGADYSVPLWSIALTNLPTSKFNEQFPFRVENDHDKYEALKARFNAYRIRYLEFLSRRKSASETVFSEINHSSSEALQQHFNDYRKRIDAFLGSFAPFSPYNSKPKLDFEVIIAVSNSASINDVGRYSTGGRTYTPINNHTIAFRSTLNQNDITFLKDIIRGKHDALIPFIDSCEEQVKFCARKKLAHYCAREFLTAKITYWLNKQGNTPVVTLAASERDYLIKHTALKIRETLSDIISNGYQTRGLVLSYLDAEKHQTPMLIHQFLVEHKRQQNNTLYYSLFGQTQVKHPQNIDSLLKHAIQDRTFLGFRNRSFYACKALGWLNNEGKLTQLGMENEEIKEAYERVCSIK